MTREEMRTKLIDGVDRLLGLSRFIVGAEQRRILNAQRAVYLSNDQIIDLIVTEYDKHAISETCDSSFDDIVDGRAD